MLKEIVESIFFNYCLDNHQSLVDYFSLKLPQTEAPEPPSSEPNP